MQVLWGILELEQPDTQTMNNIVISSVELIYCYAECLALHGKDTGCSVAPAVVLLKQLLFSPNDAVQTSSRYLNLFFRFIWNLNGVLFFRSLFILALLFQLGYIFKVAPGSISKADHVSYR
jgi:hypothetical protein